MSYKYIKLTALCLLLSATTRAQDTLATSITYDLTAETAVGTGDFTAFQLATNRHHVLSTRANTAYLRGAINISHAFNKNLTLSGGLDAIASVHANHKAYLQQCFVNLIPQIHVGTNGFWNVPYTKGWVQINFDFGYGKFLDGNYREQRFNDAQDVNDSYAKGIYYHQKHLYIRTNPTKRFFAMVGIEHAVQFGGTGYWFENGELIAKKKPANLKAFWRAILPGGDKNYFENNESLEDWVYGNHIGVMTYQIGWNINENHQVQAYLDNPFEDGSGIRKGNGWDGLWGLQYSNKTSGRQYVRGAVFEYFQSTNQSGPLHWDRGDYPEPIRDQITNKVTGNDNYYNHLFYTTYSHYGMTPGNALILSPIYNKNGSLSVLDNRVKAWHLGVNGEITDRISYLVKGSYREGWGTYFVPLSSKHHSFDAMLQGSYHVGPWQFSAAYAFDKGNIYGDCSTFNFKINFHGKIL